MASASCVDAGLSLTHDIEYALNRNLQASLLTIDVKGFFDNINHDRLVSILYYMGFPPQITYWVRSFLIGRETATRIGSFTSTFLPIDTGIPQGSPCSPILSVAYSAPILQQLARDPVFTNISLPVVPRSYIDDFSFLAISHSAETNVISLDKTLSRAVELLADAGMHIDPGKSELIHFTRAREKPVSPLVTTLYQKDLWINPKEVVRWLGIFFDPELRFKKHVEIMCNRATSVSHGLRMLANTVRGLSQRNLRILVKTCVHPILTYASPIWFRPDRPQLTLIRKLDVVQNIGLRLITGAFKTTPVEALQTLSHMPPMEITLDKLSQSAAVRLLKLPFRSLVSERLPDVWRDKRPSLHPPPFLPPECLPHTKYTKSFSSIEFLATLASPRGERVFPFAAENAPGIP